MCLLETSTRADSFGLREINTLRTQAQEEGVRNRLGTHPQNICASRSTSAGDLFACLRKASGTIFRKDVLFAAGEHSLRACALSMTCDVSSRYVRAT